MPSADDFRAGLARIFERHAAARKESVIVVSKDLHHLVGGYPPPPGAHHCMPTCCNVMRAAMDPARGDRVLFSPPKGNGADLSIRYVLPRAEGSGCQGPDGRG